MYRNLEQMAIKALKKTINKLGYEEPSEIKLEQPPNPELGDLASAVSFQLAKQLKRSPMEIAAEIVNEIKLSELFEKVELKGPYINFYVNYNKFSRMVLKSIKTDYGQFKPNNTKIIVEHTSANPNGPLHIGHIRNSIIGDSISRILGFAGYEVETQYYVNDMGRQIAMVVWGFLNLDFEMDKSEKIDHEIGKLYFQVNEKLRADPELKNEIDSLLKQYEYGNEGKLEKSFENAVNQCLEGVKYTLKKINVSHDTYVWESKFVKDGSVASILQTLKEKNVTKTNEVLYLPLEDYGIEKELVLTRSDGTSLYSTRDLAYHVYKSKNCDELIDVLGSDHKLAIDQLSIALDILDSRSPEVIFYEFITLPEGSMSTRRGVFISVDEMVEEAVQRAFGQLEIKRPDLTEEEKIDIAKKVGIGAIRYFIAKLSPEKHIVFKWDEALSFERGCASIQYAHARSCKLLKKCGYDESKSIAESEIEILDHPTEIDLIKTLSKFTSVIEESARLRRVHLLAQYALDLAGAFNKFYKSVQVKGSNKEVSRLLLVDRTRITIRNALYLLGIDAPNSM
ncbi:MAG: arginine--tRNA ligase [Methanobacteriaceae archaeon]|nr:arginine--tRNA ligase [Methanobacteriaceae archaeon]